MPDFHRSKVIDKCTLPSIPLTFHEFHVLGWHSKSPLILRLQTIIFTFVEYHTDFRTMNASVELRNEVAK
jgi:hypothetical protein